MQVDPQWAELAAAQCRKQNLPLAISDEWQLALLRRSLGGAAKRRKDGDVAASP